MLELLTSKGYAPGKDAQFFGIFWPEEVPKNPGKCHADAPSAVYQDLVTVTKGKYGDICAEDYSKKLTEISKAISTMVESKIPLTKSGVIPSTIQVTEDEFVVLDPVDWRYDGIDNSVAIKGGLKSGAIYEVTYKTEEHRSIALEAPASESTIKVTVAGQRLGVDEYVYKAESQSLFFRAPLAEDKKVSISFRDEGSLLKEFPFPNVGTKQISCSLNDQALKYLHFPSDSVIAFQPALEDGQKAVCRY